MMGVVVTVSFFGHLTNSITTSHDALSYSNLYIFSAYRPTFGFHLHQLYPIDCPTVRPAVFRLMDG